MSRNTNPCSYNKPSSRARAMPSVRRCTCSLSKILRLCPRVRSNDFSRCWHCGTTEVVIEIALQVDQVGDRRRPHLDDFTQKHDQSHVNQPMAVLSIVMFVRCSHLFRHRLR